MPTALAAATPATVERAITLVALPKDEALLFEIVLVGDIAVKSCLLVFVNVDKTVASEKICMDISELDI